MIYYNVPVVIKWYIAPPITRGDRHSIFNAQIYYDKSTPWQIYWCKQGQIIPVTAILIVQKYWKFDKQMLIFSNCSLLINNHYNWWCQDKKMVSTLLVFCNGNPSVPRWWSPHKEPVFLTGINTLRPRQNGRYFTDDIFKCIFLNENAWISLKISLWFVPGGPINNIPSLVQIMAWRRPGDKPLS